MVTYELGFSKKEPASKSDDQWVGNLVVDPGPEEPGPSDQYYASFKLLLIGADAALTVPKNCVLRPLSW